MEGGGAAFFYASILDTFLYLLSIYSQNNIDSLSCLYRAVTQQSSTHTIYKAQFQAY